MAEIDAFGELVAEIDGYGDIVAPGLGGPQGPAGEIVAASAETLPTGAQATVTLGGTPSKRTITFGLPRGAKGDQGDIGDVTPAAQAVLAQTQAVRDQAATARAGAEAAKAGALQAQTSAEAARDQAADIVAAGIEPDDSGWRTAGNAPAGVTWSDPIQYRIINRICYWRGFVKANIKAGTWTPLAENIPLEALGGSGASLPLVSSDKLAVQGGVYPASRTLEVYASADTKNSIMIGGSYPLPPLPSSLTVLQLNLWHGGSKVPGGVAAIPSVIEQCNAGVVMLSEATPDVVASITSALVQRGGEWYGVGLGDTGVISRYPISSSAAVTSFATRATLQLGGIEAAIYSVHLEYRWYAAYLPRGYGGGAQSGPTSQYGWSKIPTGPITDAATLGQVNVNSGRPAAMASIMQDAAAQQAAGRITLIGGDYNEPSHLDWTAGFAQMFDRHGVSYPWETLKALADAGWVDSYRAIYPDAGTCPAITWPIANPGVTPYDILDVDADVRDRIDFVHYPAAGKLSLMSARLVGPTGTIANGQIVPGDTQDVFQPVTGVWPSDHRGTLCRYRINR